MVPVELNLPLEAAKLLPHRPPMILVDQLIDFSSGKGRVTASVSRDDLFVGDDGQLESVALIELVAQAYATIKGYDDAVNRRPVQRGFLVGSRNFTIHRRARSGERLIIDINTAAQLDGFSVIDGVITCGDEVLAKGSIKLWLP